MKRARALWLLAGLLMTGTAGMAAAPLPTPRPADKAPDSASDRTGGIDLSGALPGKAMASLPTSAQQLETLSGELEKDRPRLKAAQARSEALAAETDALRAKLIKTAAKIETLERSQVADSQAIEKLSAEYASLSAGFVRDRIQVTKLLGILERLQHDMPPALALRPDDALSAARGAMLIGAGLPPVYAEAAKLAKRIQRLDRTRAALERRRADARETSANLNTARIELDALLAQKQRQAQGAARSYGTLKVKLDQIATQASDFKVLLARVRALRAEGGANEDGGAIGAKVVTVTAKNADSLPALQKNSLLEPVVGTVVAGAKDADSGLTYATRPGAQVITPADGKVLYAGPYHKAGQVLILEITTGYDLVLAGMGRVSVKENDQLLAGEPVGVMPQTQGPDNRLYFELRHDGHGINPAPWLKLKLRPVL